MIKGEARDAGHQAIINQDKNIRAWCNQEFRKRGLPQITQSPEQRDAIKEAMDRWDRVVDDLPGI